MSKKSRSHKYGRVVTLFGAVIVFLTFVIKDAIREQVKDAVDSLQMAETVFRNTSQDTLHWDLTIDSFREFRDRLEDIQKNIEDMKDRAGAQESSTFQGWDMDTLTEQQNDNTTLLVLDMETLSHVRRMIEKLPVKDTSLFVTSLTSLKARFESLKNVSDKELERVHKMGDFQNKDVTGALGQQLLSHWTEGEALRADISGLTAKVLTRLIEQKEADETRLKRYTWLSYVLYAIGWSLALFGRLYGVDPIAEEA